MIKRLLWLSMTGIVVAGLLAPVSAQRGGGKKPVSQPATGLFRCPGLSCPLTSPFDAILSDLRDQAYVTADGAVMGSDGEFSLVPPAGGRALVLDFTNGPSPCVGCRRDFQTITLDDSTSLVFHNNTIDPATGGEASDGLRSIPVGQTWRSRLKIAFNTVNSQGVDIAWAVRFNPDAYFPSDYIWATRTGSNTWELFATDAERAMLVSSCCRQKGGPTNEGLYVMPFRLWVTVQ